MKNRVRFDWLSFTIKRTDVNEVMSSFGLDVREFEYKPFGRFGYGSMYSHEVVDIAVMFNGTDDMGVHIAVSGGSIKYFMECFAKVAGNYTPFGYAVESEDLLRYDLFSCLARYVLQNGGFSRVDVNIDTDMEFMNPYHICELVKNGDYVSFYRSWKMIDNSDGSGTIYFGKRSGRSLIRIYDKAKEQGDFVSTLYRFEVQFNKAANEFMQNFLVMGLSDAFLAFIRKQIRFVPDGDYFADCYKEWADFLELIRVSADLNYLKYETKKRKTSVDALFHMFSQYKNVIGDFLELYGNLDDFIEYMIVVCDEKDVINYQAGKGWIA